MNRGQRAVRLDDHVGAKSADVAADTVAIERIADQVEAFEHFEVGSSNCPPPPP